MHESHKDFILLGARCILGIWKENIVLLTMVLDDFTPLLAKALERMKLPLPPSGI